jgi:transposase-like protein
VPRTCTVCAHSDRAAIDAALLNGESYRYIATRFNVSTGALQRHRNDHLPAKLAKAHEAKEVASADKLIGELDALKGKAVSLLMQAERAGDLRTALSGVREARACIETLLEVEGEIDRRTQVNVLVANPEWLHIRAAIMDALQANPEARQAVVHAIAEVSHAPGD